MSVVGETVYLYGLIIGFVVSAGLGPVVLPLLRQLRLGQQIRSDGPERHLDKAGTPTMGGILFLAGLLAGVLALTPVIPLDLRTALTLLMIFGFGALGFIDDLLKVYFKRPLGLRARSKLLGQVLLSGTLAIAALYLLDFAPVLRVPFILEAVNLGPMLYTVFVIILAIGTSNAVNLTDGLDGLVGGSMVISLLGYFLVALVVGSSQLALVSASLIGGLLGFLVYNLHPARVFMGDTGSLALGGGLAALAVLTRTELLLPLLGGLFVIIALSVIIQVISFQSTGKRVFRMAPLHHHFELVGWGEWTIVLVFWAVAAVLAAIGILGLRGLGTVM